MNVKDLIVERLCEVQTCICYERKKGGFSRYALNEFLKDRTELVQMLKQYKREV